ncbi:unnamed protein product, partial [Amoebophrya sp. A25]|eukprot:GSA25T00003261001.1
MTWRTSTIQQHHLAAPHPPQQLYSHQGQPVHQQPPCLQEQQYKQYLEAVRRMQSCR